MMRAWIERLKIRRRDRLARDYGNLTEEERIEAARMRGELGARDRGYGVTYGHDFDQRLDAEEGRPRH